MFVYSKVLGHKKSRTQKVQVWLKTYSSGASSRDLRYCLRNDNVREGWPAPDCLENVNLLYTCKMQSVPSHHRRVKWMSQLPYGTKRPRKETCRNSKQSVKTDHCEKGTREKVLPPFSDRVVRSRREPQGDQVSPEQLEPQAGHARESEKALWGLNVAPSHQEQREARTRLPGMTGSIQL